MNRDPRFVLGFNLVARLIVVGFLTWSVRVGPATAQVPPPDGEWTLNASVESPRAVTDLGLGAVQGVAVRDGKVYAYGDVVFAKPRVGVIREYDLDFKPTGRVVWLRRDGKPLILHPTGLTWDDAGGRSWATRCCKKAVIYRLDWERAWQDGDLDHAVLDVIDDDAAINGCRPTFVTLGGRTLLATSDYGDVRPEIRLYDPEALLAAKRSSAPGVVVHRVLCGPFNQNLHWDADTGRLTCVQNVIEGRGWRLDVARPGEGRRRRPGRCAGRSRAHAYLRAARRTGGLLAARRGPVPPRRRPTPGQPHRRRDPHRRTRASRPPERTDLGGCPHGAGCSGTGSRCWTWFGAGLRTTAVNIFVQTGPAEAGTPTVESADRRWSTAFRRNRLSARQLD